MDNYTNQYNPYQNQQYNPNQGQPYNQQPNSQYYNPAQGQPYYPAPPTPYMPPNASPVTQLSTTRGLGKFILLSLVTFGIYGLVYYSSVSTDINIIASRYDGKKTMHYCLATLVLAPLTCGIYSFIWGHQISERIGNELRRRGINYSFGASDYWIWNVLGIIFLAGPFIYVHKLSTAMNYLSSDFNIRG